MKLLLDTHIFCGSSTVTDDCPWSHETPSLTRRMSCISAWYRSGKHYQVSDGKLPLPQPPEMYLPDLRKRHRIASLIVSEGSVAQVAALPPLHRDPFDRLLIGQALQHGLTLATVDSAIHAYPMVQRCDPVAICHAKSPVCVWNSAGCYQDGAGGAGIAAAAR